MQASYEEASSQLATSEQKVLDASSRMCELESQVARLRTLVEVRSHPVICIQQISNDMPVLSNCIRQYLEQRSLPIT